MSEKIKLKPCPFCGNGLCLYNALYVMEGIAEEMGKDVINE